MPTLGQSSLSVAPAYNGFYRYSATDLLDMRFGRVFQIREKLKVEPVLDLYNILNSNTITSEVTTVGSKYGEPSAILEGRLLRLGFELRF